MKRLFLFTLLLTVAVLTGCNISPVTMMNEASNSMMGGNGSMMARHHATIPAAYAELTSPVLANEKSLARGAEIYSANCVACHGDGGMGDGPAATNLDPAPAPIAHTSLMLEDSYLFWRISEGGVADPFNSAMPVFQTILDEQARWDVINYVRAIGSGQVTPPQIVGGATFDPETGNAIRAEILAQAVAQNVITQDEADVFNQIHSEMDRLAASDTFAPDSTGREEAMLADLVESGKITQIQADTFNTVHHKLTESNLMQE